MGAMEEGDGVIGSVAEVNLDSQVEWWCDKYQPRKPKYVNTFHTGYEWNKYNRTHYDHENPPPKIVRGYKFNIFYPDMINRTETPTYTCEDDGSNGETCIIRFHAGPPYEDIAFRIVKKDWDVSHKRGFKSTSDGVILRLMGGHFGEELLRDEVLKRGALEDELLVEKLLVKEDEPSFFDNFHFSSIYEP
ncbi:hypothetical protein Peur_039189 [Populus x canadensis]